MESKIKRQRQKPVSIEASYTQTIKFDIEDYDIELDLPKYLSQSLKTKLSRVGDLYLYKFNSKSRTYVEDLEEIEEEK